MKLVEDSDEQKTVRLGIVKLGTAVGKMKYALIDECDIPVIHEYKFDARLEIDRNGDGIRVIPMGHPKALLAPAASTSTPTPLTPTLPIPLQNILWQHRHGYIEPGYKVRHLNGITMDNRLENLTLVPDWISSLEQDEILQGRCTEIHVWDPTTHNSTSAQSNGNGGSSSSGEEDLFEQQQDPEHLNKREKRRGENSLYWKAITQLLANETEEQRNASSAPCSRAYYTTEGELISRDCPSFYFFECHYPPCTAIESEPREYAMCGRCQQARYCGRECQRDDWTIHREHCLESHRRSGHHGSGSGTRSGVKSGSGRNKVESGLMGLRPEADR